MTSLALVMFLAHPTSALPDEAALSHPSRPSMSLIATGVKHSHLYLHTLTHIILRHTCFVSNVSCSSILTFIFKYFHFTFEWFDMIYDVCMRVCTPSFL